MGPELTAETEMRVRLSFPCEELAEACQLLRDECGNNLPFWQNSDSLQMERVRFAVLKLSEGDTEKLRQAVRLAQQDWRDLLVTTGFADDVEAHKSWVPTWETKG